MDDIGRMTCYEYELRKRAYALAEVDEEYRIHRMAWVHREIKAEKKTGKNKSKPVYRRFKDFFDYEKVQEEVRNRALGKRKEVSGTSERMIEYLKRRKISGKL